MGTGGACSGILKEGYLDHTGTTRKGGSNSKKGGGGRRCGLGKKGGLSLHIPVLDIYASDLFHLV